MENLGRVATSLTHRDASNSGSSSGTNRHQAATYATERATLMFGCYRRGDANDPDTYVSAIAAVLADYEPDVIQSVTDPRSGLPSKSDWPPTVREVKSACEEIAGPRRRAQDWDRAAAENLRQRALPPPPRPTLEELKAKYGPNWGLKTIEEPAETKQKRAEHIQRANAHAFAAECKAAGVDPNRVASPSLERLLHGPEQAEARMRRAERLGAKADRLAAAQAAE